MQDEEKIMRVEILDGDEVLEVPAWIAQQYGVFSEEVGGEEEIREAVEDPYTHDW